MRDIKDMTRLRQKKIPPLPGFDKGVLTFKSDAQECEPDVMMPPLITGTLTDWKYIPMIKIEDFLMCLDS
jgi:hypothetical protein